MSESTPEASGCCDGDVPAESAAFEAGHHHGYLSDKDAYLRRLRRIEGQVRGIERLVDEEAYCVDIITQISAVTSALENVGLALMNDHLKSCVSEAATVGGQASEAVLDEAMAAVRRLVKS